MNLLAKSIAAITASSALALAPAFAFAGDEDKHGAHPNAQTGAAAEQQTMADRDKSKDQKMAKNKEGPHGDLKEASRVIQQMHGDTELKQTLGEAKAVFVVPTYATAALIIGGEGGEGVLLSQREGEWGNPAFYNVGAISAGLQAGVSAGSIALILMTDKAVEAFKEESNFELTSSAGLSVVNWSERAQGEIGEGNDVIAWTDTEGLFGELSVAVSNINWDEEANQEYYGQPTTPDQVISGMASPQESEKVSQVTPR